jgi:hypothetical protein
MMKTFKTVEQEVNQIRLKIYEETRNLTPEQYTERVRRIGENAAKKYGFRRIEAVPIVPDTKIP